MARPEYLYVRLGDKAKEDFYRICCERETTMAQKARDLIINYIKEVGNAND